MSKSIIFQSDTGMVFEKTTYKNGRCKLVVKRENGGSASATRSAMIYRYNDIPGLQSPYISWENINCCGGWSYNETYLYTAVQRGKKLFADIVFIMYDEDWAEEQQYDFANVGRTLPVEADAERIIQALEAELPADCVLRRSKDREAYRARYRGIQIYKKGAISDYINMDEVFSAYERLGITMSPDAEDYIRNLAALSIEVLSDRLDWLNPSNSTSIGSAASDPWLCTEHSLILTGLLLGYPVETTASLILKGDLSAHIM